LADSSFAYAGWPKTISDKLNAAWDPAWNVALVSTVQDLAFNSTADFRNVVYGYAYNGHWLWYNKYNVMKHPVSPGYYAYFSFIIWKDYNCNSWVTHSSYSTITTSTKKDAIKNAIKGIATK
jgi:hypothetical protein